MNPLHAEGWFALGYCALKTGDFGRALQAFSRSAQQEPENGDAWNNLAAIHLQVPLFRLFTGYSEVPDTVPPSSFSTTVLVLSKIEPES